MYVHLLHRFHSIPCSISSLWKQLCKQKTYAVRMNNVWGLSQNTSCGIFHMFGSAQCRYSLQVKQETTLVLECLKYCCYGCIYMTSPILQDNAWI